MSQFKTKVHLIHQTLICTPFFSSEYFHVSNKLYGNVLLVILATPHFSLMTFNDFSVTSLTPSLLICFILMRE